MTIGQRLKTARRAKQISGEALGEVIGVSKGQISNMERGVSDITKSNALVLCEKLGIRLAWLLTGEGDMVEGEGANQSVSVGRIKGDQNNTGFGSQVNQGVESSRVTALEKEIDGLKMLLYEKDERIQELKETIAHLRKS